MIRKTVYGNSQSEVIKKIDLIKHELVTGEYVEPDKMTIKQWLDYWLKNYKKQYVKPRTYDSYESLSNHSRIPFIGKIQLQKLTIKDIQMLYSDKLDKGVSGNTISKINIVLKSAIKQAVLEGYVSKNPAALVMLPKRNLDK